MRSLLLFFSLFFFLQLLNAQEDPEPRNFPSSKLVEKVPASPGVANLGQYGEQYINKYNGSANINLNIYSITDPVGEFSFDLNLSYNTSGVKVQDEASWVGLGWSFFEDIIITREINGFDDLRNYQNNTGSELDAESIGWIFSPTFLKFDGSKIDISEEDLSYLEEKYRLQQPIDTEPDLFTVRLPDISLQFFLPKINQGGGILEADIINNNAHKVFYDLSNETFEVIDDKGNVFIFSAKEFTTTYSSWDAPEASSEEFALYGISPWHTNQTRKLNTGWKISSLTSYNNRTIDFNYEDGFFLSFPSFSESFSQQLYKDHGAEEINLSSTSSIKVTASLSAFHKKYLSEITGDFGKVIFNLSGRSDLYSKETHSLLTNQPSWEPHISPNENNEKKLDQILVYNKEDELITEANFYYTYFNSDKKNGSNEKKFLRLKLDKIKIQEKEYSFSYYSPNSLPAKDSKSTDFWGFYNGIPNEIRIPSANRFFLVGASQQNNYSPFEKYFRFYGANKSSDIDYGKIGNLKSITYPTKGSTYFNYESHSVNLQAPSFSPSYNAEGDIRSSGLNSSQSYNFRYQYLKTAIDSTYSFLNNNTCGISSQSISQNSETFLITEEDLCNNQDFNFSVSYDLYCNVGCGQGINPSGKAVWIENIDTGEEIILESYDFHFSQNNGYKNFSKDLNLPVGNYKLRSRNWSVNEPYLVVATASATGVLFSNEESANSNEEFYVGGSRLKEILNYDSAQNLISRKSFGYTVENEFGEMVSSGKLMDDLVYMSRGYGYQEYTPENHSDGEKVTLTSNNLLKTNNSAQGSHIGYSVVSEEYLDDSEISNGKILNLFYNKANSYPERYIGQVRIDFSQPEEAIYGNVYLLSESPFNYSSINGKVLNTKYYDSDNNILRSQQSKFDLKNGYYPGFTRYPVLNMAGNVLSSNYPFHTVLNSDPIQNKISLVQERIQTQYLNDKEISDTVSFNYTSKNRLKEKTSENSDGSKNKVIYHYTFGSDYPMAPNFNNQNRFLPFKQERKLIENGVTKIIATQTTDFTQDQTGNLVPSGYRNWKGTDTLNQKSVYVKNYDNFGNILEFEENNGKPITYLWGYRGYYLVAIIKNATLSDVSDALNKSVSELQGSSFESSEIESINSQLRNELPSAEIETFIYKPLMGLTKSYDARGEINIFEYDVYNRLDITRDLDNNILKEYEYNFKN